MKTHFFRLASFALIGAFLLLGTPAAAQQSILQSGTWTSGHVPVYSGSSSNYPVVRDSGAAPAVINSGTIGQVPYYAATGSTLTGNANLTISTAAVTFGVTGTSLGSLSLAGSTSGLVTIKPQPVAGTFNFNLPIIAGASGKPLLSAGGGSAPMTWGSLSGNTSTFVTSTGALTSGHCAVFDSDGNLADNGSGCGGSGTVNSGTSGTFAYYASTGTAVSGSAVLSVSGTATTATGTFTSAGLTSTAAVALSPANANVVISPTGTGLVTINPATTGSIANVTASTTTLTASGAVTLSPANANVVASPTGTGTVTLNPATAGTLDNMAVGATTPRAGTHTTLTATGAVSLSPANANVVLSPTGTGVVTIAPAAASTINNASIGATTRAAGSFTTATASTVVSAGIAGTSTGSMQVNGGTSGTITIQPQSTAGTYNFNLPNTAGTTGQPLISGAGGATAMSWGSLSGNTSVFATTNGAMTNGNCVSIDSSGNLQASGAACATGSGTVASGTSGQMTYYASSTNAVAGNANANISGGALTLGIANSVLGSLKVTGSSSGTVTITPQAAAGTYNFNLPTTAGTSGTPLISAGGGASPMTYGTLSGNTSKFVTSSGSFTTGNCVSADASGNLVDNGTPCGTGGSGTVTSSTAGQIAYYPSSSTVVAGNSSINVSAGALTLGVAATTIGQLKVIGNTSGVVTITPQAAAGTYEFDLPTTAGTSGQVLTSAGGAGSPMTWSTPGLTSITAQTANFNAASNGSYCVDTVTGTATVTATLPASPASNDTIQFLACSNYSTYNLIISRNGNNIQGVAENMTVSTNNAAFSLKFVTSYGWRMF